MKPHNFSNDGSLIQEAKSMIREKLKKACEVAMFSVEKNVIQKGCRCSRLVSNENQRRQTSATEDPIRTLVFLASWTHI
uniref:Uncharacterized protein n=1 Tax=Nelumbo nucifera TaxID=4432 RepID=A0A822YLD7_NELNU|nr:TPA_asm: hypothetical protein HUJ06_012193 [Nelumbo nucifera]